ncbi:5295_t:CDS:2 [Diversispora eburnea]|uniref:5295_t:CDS:1 n=1 Tax=Diversispora eburnea TaxID=1213867 RepID=A0A9N8YMQ6_9GLOM|nr:5295_t:CDS:2 [Diversispora eburnea]
MLEIGLQQIDVYAEKNNLKVIGYYHANERADDNRLPPFGQKIASKIYDNFNNAIAFVVQNTKLAPENPEIAILAKNQWRPDNKAFSSPTNIESSSLFFSFENSHSAIDLTSQSIKQKYFEYLYDFDEHLENIEADWLINSKIVDLTIAKDKKGN